MAKTTRPLRQTPSFLTSLGDFWRVAWRPVGLLLAVIAAISPSSWLNLVLGFLTLAPGLGKGKPVEILSRVLSGLLSFLAGLFLQGFILDLKNRREKKLKSSPEMTDIMNRLERLLDWRTTDSLWEAFYRIPQEWNQLEDIRQNEKRQIQTFGERFGQRAVLVTNHFRFFRERLMSDLPLRSLVLELVSIMHDIGQSCELFSQELTSRQFDVKLLPMRTWIIYISAETNFKNCDVKLRLFLLEKLHYMPKQVDRIWSEASTLPDILRHENSVSSE